MKRIPNLVNCLIVIGVLFAHCAVRAETQFASFSVNVRGEGPDMILIPGLMSDQRVWEPIIEPLASQYRLHLINLAGFSGNPPMTNPSLGKVKTDLLSYIVGAELKEPIVVGHSLGGFLGMWMAIESANQIGSVISVDGLPFYGVALTLDGATTAEDMMPMAQQVASLYATFNSEQIIQMSQQNMYIQTVKQENIEKINEMIRGSDGATVGSAMAFIMTTDLRSQLNKITAPLLLLGATGATVKTEYESKAEEVYRQGLEANPSATLRINNKSGHFITLDDPDWVLQQLQEFLGVR